MSGHKGPAPLIQLLPMCHLQFYAEKNQLASVSLSHPSGSWACSPPQVASPASVCGKAGCSSSSYSPHVVGKEGAALSWEVLVAQVLPGCSSFPCSGSVWSQRLEDLTRPRIDQLTIMVISLQTAHWSLPSVMAMVPLSPGSLKIYTVKTGGRTSHFEITPSGFF